MAEASIKHIGRYEIQAELGRGGYGRVYRAYDPTVGRLVAIKVLTGEGTDLLKRFRNEASAAGSLNHRNIVTIYDFGEHDGMPYIAMEFLAGDDLSQIIANRTPLTMLQKVNIMMQVAEGLYSAHRNGVVHRDVKPANIRLLPDGTVKILDFGIARLTRDSTSPRLTRQGDVIGTLLYMSPEQIMSADVDALSDIFAYGVTYYELLTGKHPFHAADAGAVLYKITSVDPEPIRNHTPECPEALEQVVRRALHRERELRYQSLRELQIDTEPILLELRQKRASVLLDDARNCFAEDDLERAEAHVMEALALDPSNTAGRKFRNEVQQRLQSRRLQSRIDAILAEGDHALKQRRFAEAAERFQSALQVYPENEKLKGRLQQARELLERSRAAAQLLAEARKHFFQKGYSAALRIASEAAQIDPECTDVARFVQSVQTAAEREERRLRFQQVLGAAQELLDQNLFDQAAAALAELDSEQSDSAEAKALIESLNTRRAEFERAEREQAERIRTELAAATEELRNSAFLQAFERLSTLRREVPENEDIGRLLALAEKELSAQKRAAEIEVLVREARSFVESDQYGRALGVIEDALRSFAGDARLLQLLEEVKAGQERIASIRSALAEAKTRLEAGRPEEAVQVLEPVSAKFTGEAQLEQVLRQAREALQKRQKAEAVERAEREVHALVEAEKFDKALDVIEAARRQHGGDPGLAELTERIGRAREERHRAVAVQTAAANAEALIQAGKPEEAIRVLEPASAEFTGEAQLEQVLRRAREALQKKQKAEAVERAEREVHALVEAEKFDKALDVIEAVRRQHGGDPALARLTERIESVRERRRRAVAVQTAAANAEALIQAGKPEEAIRVLEPASAEFAGEAQLEQALRQAREALQKKQKAEAVERAEREVQSLVEAGEFERAVAVIAAVRREHGDDPALAPLTERIAKGREERRRVAAVQTAVANGEALVQAGKPEEAIRVLEVASVEFTGEAQLEQVLRQARQALKQKQKAEAIEHAVREVQALVEAGEFDKARKSLKAALKKHPQEARLLELRNQIQTARAGRELDEARPPQEVPQQLEPKLAERSPLITPRRAIAVAAVLVAGVGAVLVIRQINAPPGGTIPVEVRTSPAGAVVRYKDGSCTPPDCRLQLAPGDYAFEVQLPGYRTETRKTTVVKNSAPVSLEIALSALPSTVQLTTTFADGSVTLDGRTAGRLRDGQFIADNLGPGRHELEAKGGDGDVKLTFETAEAKRPLLSSPPSTRDADAVVVTAFGNEVAVNCARCNGEAVLDGTLVGRFVGGQLTLKGVSAGTHELQVGGGAAPRKLVFAVGTQPSLVTYLTSARDRGILLVQTGLDDAVVYIGGKQWPRRTERGELSIPLDAKEYEVRVEKQGYRVVPPVVRAAVRKGEQVRAPFRLEPLEAVLTITGQVPGATVAVDRKLAGAVGGNGVFSVQVQPGERRIELSKDGYQPAAISRSFSPGERLQLGTDQLRLQPIPRPAPEPAPVKAVSPPPPPQPSPAELEAQQWQHVRDSRDISDLAEFLTRYPGGRFAREAEARIEELEWSATNRNNLASLEAFLAKHPRGTFVGEARKQIAQLQQEQQQRSEGAAVRATVSRYEEAYRRRDAAGVRALYVNMPNNQFDQIRKSFSVFQVISFQLKPEEPQVAGETATVRCVRMLTVKDNRGAEQTANDVALFRLKKEGNEWRIVSLSPLN
ncbi:MAG TPA: protein kinase [Bryobacteraceae bacterium]|nr:protein kinase [Bryobacteraceae bacterium]